ncbi:uncharacterized protein N7482_001184 [Penicillium canariense]|uniref:Uncharacterized protein n=1 Tax=Penicillium canariense TaxID=189055 RepID=A0A9W9LTW5_9EURO|nr:uncharacterized protein N7482_001184 [Penicillium canariense]KAJ5175307.1 hypothetical protein N7482_001184 [Penicillium canariense]
MVTAAEPRRQNRNEDRQAEPLGAEDSVNDSFSTIREQGLGTGVRVNDDGRLDIKFREQKPWFTTLMKHVQEPPQPIAEQQEQPTSVPRGDIKFPWA